MEWKKELGSFVDQVSDLEHHRGAVIAAHTLLSGKVGRKGHLSLGQGQERD